MDAAAFKRAGIAASEVEDVITLWEKCKRIDAVLPAVEKLCELLVETRLMEGHNLAIRLGEMAYQIRRRGTRTANGTEVMAPFETLLNYHFGPGQQAAATREKKKKAQAEPEQSGTELPIPQQPL